MAMKEPLMVKTGLGVDKVSLVAPVGESYLIKNIYVAFPASATVRVLIDKTTVGFFYLGGAQKSDLVTRAGESELPNVLQVLRDSKIFRPYPVESGQTFSLVFDSGTSNDVFVEYSVYDASDIKATDPNGSLSSDYDVILYGYPSTIISDGYSKYDTALDPDEFPKFPFSEVVPSKTTITINALLHYAVARTSGSGGSKSEERYIKFQRDRVVLFDTDRNGLPYLGSASAADGVVTSPGILIDYGQTNDASNIFFFPNPLILNAGDDLDIYSFVSVVLGTQSLQSDDLRIGLVANIKSTT